MYEQIIQALTIIGALGGAVGTAYSGWRWLVRPIRKFFSNLANACNSLPEIQKELTVIKDELKPNGGMSLRDAVNRIERNLLIEKHARRAMTMAMDVAVFETDENGSCVWVNHMYKEITGLDAEQAKGLGWISSIHEMDRERVSEEWEDIVEQKRSFHMQYKMININSFKATNVKCDSFPIANDHGEVVGHVGIITVLPDET